MKDLATAFVVLAFSSLGLAQAPALDPDAAGPADRIWSANPDDVHLWLRRPFALPGTVTAARLVFSCDNECRVFVNGREVAAADSWMDVTVVDLEQLGTENVIAVEAKNTGGPGAFACWLLWTDEKGTAHALTSDAAWRVTTDPAALRDGWRRVGFDDTAWPTATPNFTSTYGLNLYNGAPTRVHFRNRHSGTADAIGTALEQLRRAIDRGAARKALDAIERAVMDARARLWQEEQAEQQRAGRR